MDTKPRKTWWKAIHGILQPYPWPCIFALSRGEKVRTGSNCILCTKQNTPDRCQFATFGEQKDKKHISHSWEGITWNGKTTSDDTRRKSDATKIRAF